MARMMSFRFTDRKQVPIGDHSRLWADRRFECSLKALIANPPDWAEMQAWKEILAPDSLFVDVGANIGIYSLWAADLGAEVIAVEPVAEIRQALRENAALNGYDFEIVPAALSREPGIMKFTDGWPSTMNHLVPENEAGGVDVEVRTLDTVLGDRVANGLKIDVEGAERLVLEGGSRAMAERRLPVIQLEWTRMSDIVYGESREKLADLLQSHGYQFFRADEEGKLREVGAEFGPGEIFAVLTPPFQASDSQ
jgi:FkbM family methyltransferase